jgi:glutaredoxin-like protein NrdH
MFDDYDWNEKEGRGNPADLTLLALSTCGFCASARAYLEDRGFAYRYLHLDKLPAEEKSALKEEFRGKFGRRPSFPTLVIDGERFLIGFIKKHWDEEVRSGED